MIKRFFSQLGCLLWFLMYLIASFFAGRWAFFALPPIAPLALKYTSGLMVGIVVLALLGTITFLVVVATDKNYDNPSPFSILPLPENKVRTPKEVDESGAL